MAVDGVDMVKGWLRCVCVLDQVQQSRGGRMLYQVSKGRLGWHEESTVVEHGTQRLGTGVMEMN